MNDITTQVKQTLIGQAHEIAPPPIDHAGFEQAVRGVRRRRRIAVTGVTGIAATAALVTGLMVAVDSASDEDRLMPATSGPGQSVEHPGYLMAGSGFVAGIHQDDSWGMASISLDGIEDSFRTTSGLLLVGRESRLYQVDVDPDGHPVRSFSFSDDEPLTEGAVQSVVVARSGTTAAWISLDNHVVEWDVADGSVTRRTGVSPQARLFAVDTDGVLLQDPGHEGWDDRVYLQTDRRDYRMGRMLAGPVESADLTSNAIALTSGASTVVVRRDEHGEPSDDALSFDAGAGQLAPDGRHYVGQTMEESTDGSAAAIAIWDTTSGDRFDFTGLPDFTHQAAWLDDETVAVTGGARSDTRDVYVCSVESMACERSLSEKGLSEATDETESLQLPSSFVAAS